MKKSEVVDARVGDVHVEPEQIADINIGTYGEGDYVFPVGRKLETEIITNNKVRIFDGAMVYGGIRDVIDPDRYYDIAIDNGAQGKNRNDIIVRRYIKDESSKFAGSTFELVKGTAVEGTAVDPDIPFTDLRGGALTHDMALHRVRIEGLSIVGVDPMFTLLDSLSALNCYLNDK